MREKEFDIFMVYSETDEAQIEKIADILRCNHVLLWYKGWRMKPEDSLRKRIIHGIENANVFLLVISENSLNSPWVAHELNAALIDEIEQAHVKVILSTIGEVDKEQLSADLQAKDCLDFRNHKALQKSINTLLEVVQPERGQRKKLLERLRSPVQKDSQTIKELGKFANGHTDQAIQIAAMSGLATIGGPEAVLAVTERVLNDWGMSAITKAIKILEKLRNDGGLLALAATLIDDYRFYEKKLDALAEGAKKLGANKTHQILTNIASEIGEYPYSVERDYLFKIGMSKILERLSSIPLDDVRYGAILARSISSTLPWAGNITQPEKSIVDQACLYAEQRVPGLVNLVVRSS